MKFLAIERALPAASAEQMQALLTEEAERLWELQRTGAVRECYFTPQHDAVLVLECADEQEASELLASLPLVREKQIRFEVLGLAPYTGFERLFGDRKQP
jgi:muconolactone delta-isomerase